ncbi:MAG TPA: sialidase family protein [Pyrinomonadaceae bacterium]|nr:sialidase family protein [Pyrinomonadaceae bacterium]
MTNKHRLAILGLLALLTLSVCISYRPAKVSAQNSSHDPTWWSKYEFIRDNGGDAAPLSTTSTGAGSNVDVSNECGPQSETFITINQNKPKTLAGGSNEIFRLPMRGYYSTNGGGSWGGVDLPLPPAKGNGTDFGSDPTLAFDTQGNVFYGYIVVFFGNGNGINGTEMAVAKSTDGGKTYPSVNFFSFENGTNHFNDKPMITADTNAGSALRDNVYIAWDAASGGSIGGGVRVAASSDHGANFSVTRADDPSGPGRSIGASPAVGPNGELYVAWNDYVANAIVFNRSFDAGRSWGVPVTVSGKTLPFDIGIPAESFRGALVYPSLGVDVSNGPHRGRLYCSWMDLTPAHVTDIFLSYSDNGGATWSTPAHVPDQFSFPVDRFNHWMSIDPANGDVNVAFYDTRNDTTGARFQTDYYLARSTNGGVSFPAADIRVSTVSSNEHDCNGIFPCDGINYGNQQGDYEGLVSFNGTSYPIWTDSRRQLTSSTGCRRPLLMEEVFSAVVK